MLRQNRCHKQLGRIGDPYKKPKRTNKKAPRGKHRYFVNSKLILHDWPRTWEVTFVDDEIGLEAWLSKFTPVVFDSEASNTPRKLGLLQLATSTKERKVLVIDAVSTKIDWNGKNIRSIFGKTLTGFSISGDRKWLQERGVDASLLTGTLLRDLQKERPSTAKEEKCFEKFTVTNHGVTSIKKTLSLDDYSECLLGRRSKIQLTKHGEKYMPGWAYDGWRFHNTEIHYASNDVVALAYMLPHFNPNPSALKA